MKKNSFLKWWFFKVKNPVVREGEYGGFRWVFRRFTLEITTLSGNFSAVFTADEHPYAYLLAGKDDDNIKGFCQTLYQTAMLLTTEQKFVDDIQKALTQYQKRLDAKAKVEEDETEEKAAVEEVKAVQEYVEKSPKERRKADRVTDKKFKKAVKSVGKKD